MSGTAYVMTTAIGAGRVMCPTNRCSPGFIGSGGRDRLLSAGFEADYEASQFARASALGAGIGGSNPLAHDHS